MASAVLGRALAFGVGLGVGSLGAYKFILDELRNSTKTILAANGALEKRLELDGTNSTLISASISAPILAPNLAPNSPLNSAPILMPISAWSSASKSALTSISRGAIHADPLLLAPFAILVY